jgi:hypothetical protein
MIAADFLIRLWRIGNLLRADRGFAVTGATGASSTDHPADPAERGKSRTIDDFQRPLLLFLASALEVFPVRLLIQEEAALARLMQCSG